MRSIYFEIKNDTLHVNSSDDHDSDNVGIMLQFTFGYRNPGWSLRYLAEILRNNDVSWLAPLTTAHGPWLIHLDQLRAAHDELRGQHWAFGAVYGQANRSSACPDH
jgi:hypothetical protein